jgi:mRNA-degrading endonuclease RelE of RelBE toxin-antitoxin system
MNLNIVSIKSFLKEVKALHKRYKNIAKDLQTLKEELITNPKSGVALVHNCYKIRLANSSVPTGERSGFRVIYYYIDDKNNLYLLSIYSKRDIANISDEKLLAILKKEGLI